MTTLKVFDGKTCKFLKGLIIEPAIILILLAAIAVTTIFKNVLFPSTTIVVDVIIYAEYLWVVILVVKYSFKMLVELYIEIIENVKKVTL